MFHHYQHQQAQKLFRDIQITSSIHDLVSSGFLLQFQFFFFRALLFEFEFFKFFRFVMLVFVLCRGEGEFFSVFSSRHIYFYIDSLYLQFVFKFKNESKWKFPENFNLLYKRKQSMPMIKNNLYLSTSTTQKSRSGKVCGSIRTGDEQHQKIISFFRFHLLLDINICLVRTIDIC